MKSVSDTALMAYADGELSGPEARDVEVFLGQSPEGRRRLEVFTSTRAALNGTFDQPMNEPVPQFLIDAVNAMPLGRSDHSNVVPFATAKGRARVAPVAAPRFAFAAAACVSALVVGAGATWFLNGKPVGQSNGAEVAILENGVLVASPPVAERLDTARSGQAVALTVNGATGLLTPAFTFATSDKQFCRQYEISGISGGATAGVACRQESGRWRVEFQGGTLAQAGDDGKVRPAKGQPGNAPVDAAVDRLISGDPISIDAEQTLISKGWRDSNP